MQKEVYADIDTRSHSNRADIIPDDDRVQYAEIAFKVKNKEKSGCTGPDVRLFNISFGEC